MTPIRPSPPAHLRAAMVRRPHGVRGAVRIEALGGDATRFVPGLRLGRDGTGETYTVRSARALPDGDVLLELNEVGSREMAERLRGAYLTVATAHARRLRDDEWFVYQLVGLRVTASDGADIGVVEDVEEYAEHEVLVVRGDPGIRRIPMVRAFVRRVDLDGGVVEVTPWAED